MLERQKTPKNHERKKNQFKREIQLLTALPVNVQEEEDNEEQKM